MGSVARSAYRSLLERARLFDRQPALKSALAGDLIPAEAPECEQWTRRLFGGRSCYHPTVSFEEVVREAFRQPVGAAGEGPARIDAAMRVVRAMNEALDELAREGYVNERGETAPLRDLSEELPGVHFRIEDRIRNGSLLVAHPTWQTPSFHQTVVYVCQRSEMGDITLVLNRPLHTSLRHLLGADPITGDPPNYMASGAGSDSLGDLMPLADEPVHFGGNTSVRKLLALHRVPTVGEVLPGCRGLRLTAKLDAVASEVAAGYAHSSDALLFAGFTLWGPGKLENGVREGHWILSSAFDSKSGGEEPLPLLPSFTHSARERLWAIALTRLGGEYAHFPALEGFLSDVEHEVETPC